MQKFCGNTRLLLHARSLRFQEPYSDNMIQVIAPVDDEWQQVCQAFGWELDKF